MSSESDFVGKFARSGVDALLHKEGNAIPWQVFPFGVELSPVHKELQYASWRDPEDQRFLRASFYDLPCVRRVLLPRTKPSLPAGAWLASLSGCKGPFSFEVVLARDKVDVYLVAGPSQIDVYAERFEVHHPGSATVAAVDPLQDLAELATVVDYYPDVPYNRVITSQSSWWGSLLKIANQLGRNDIAVAQTMFEPVRRPWQQNLTALNQHQRGDVKPLHEPLLALVFRVGSTNASVEDRLVALAGQFAAGGRPLLVRRTADYRGVLTRAMITRSFRERSSHTVGQLMVSSEAAHFVHVPEPEIETDVLLPFLYGLPVPNVLRTGDVYIGTNYDRGTPINIYLRKHGRFHWTLPGATQMGKSTLQENAFCTFALQGFSVIYFDPHGYSSDRLTGCVAGFEDRTAFLAFDGDRPLLYNPFVGVPPAEYGRYASDFAEVLAPPLEADHLSRGLHVLRNGIYALFAIGHNLSSLLTLYSRTPAGERMRAEVLRNVRHPAVLQFWRDEFPTLSASVFAPIINRLSALFLDEHTLSTLSQRENTVDFRRILLGSEQHALIVKLPSVWEPQRIVGGTMLGQILYIATRRKQGARPVVVIVDEASRFSGSPFAQYLDQLAKFRVYLRLAYQSSGQIPTDLQRTILSTDTFIFGSNHADAKHYASPLNDRVAPETIKSLRPGEVYARLAGGHIVNFTTPPPLVPDPAIAERVMASSLAHYYGPVMDGTLTVAEEPFDFGSGTFE